MRTHASNEQIIEAFANLTPHEFSILRFRALQVLGNSGFSEPLDLIHEALHRSLMGRRHWPPNVDFVLYLIETMRSIAWGRRNTLGMIGSVPWHGGSDSMIALEARPSPSAEDEAIERESLAIAERLAREVRERFDGDRIAEIVFECIMEDLTPVEICDIHGLDFKVFDAARQRVLRRLAQAGKPYRTSP